MKFLLVLIAFVATAYAGVGVVTPEIEAKALRLWQQYCAQRLAGRNDGGNSLAVHCKISGETISESQQHTLNIASRGPQSDQIVFVQPPSHHYKHDVVVTGGGGSAPKTVIYVKPAKNTHEVNVEDKTTGGRAPQKPSLYFLKGNHGGDQKERRETELVTPPGPYLKPSDVYN